MKELIFILTLSAIWHSVTSVFGALITFGDLALKDYGDHLRYSDVVIQTYPGSHLQVSDQSADGFGNAHSLPTKLSVWGNQPTVRDH